MSFPRYDEGYFENQRGYIPLDSHEYAKVRIWASEIGRKIVFDRKQRSEYRPIGIVFWSDYAHIKANANKRTWPYGTPDRNTIEKRINELARFDLFNPRWWLHLPTKHEDIDPNAPGSTLRKMSCYVPNPEIFIDDAEWVLKSTSYPSVASLISAIATVDERIMQKAVSHA